MERPDSITSTSSTNLVFLAECARKPGLQGAGCAAFHSISVLIRTGPAAPGVNQLARGKMDPNIMQTTSPPFPHGEVLPTTDSHCFLELGREQGTLASEISTNLKSPT